MPITVTQSGLETTRRRTVKVSPAASRRIAWSSVGFALLQSVCTFFAAVDGLRVAIGIGSLTISAWVGPVLDEFHTDWVRVPMITFALAGAILNLVVLVQVRHLRNRPASQWRRVPLTRRKVWMERLQLTLSIATLGLVGIEEYIHLRWNGHL